MSFDDAWTIDSRGRLSQAGRCSRRPEALDISVATVFRAVLAARTHRHLADTAVSVITGWVCP
ncbi:hypothetical protein C8039_02475 [Halogeometricum sp. wsp3]|nr:hypothetical protein C8039_02475 [Halogeometricum sp. wsp3]